MVCLFFVFFFKQKTAYEMRISDWSSDVCSSDLQPGKAFRRDGQPALAQPVADRVPVGVAEVEADADPAVAEIGRAVITIGVHLDQRRLLVGAADLDQQRSEEHTSELQSLMRISYAVFCLKKKNITCTHISTTIMSH